MASSDRPIRPLLIAEAANPALTSASLVGWSCARAIAERTGGHIVTEWRNRGDFLKAGLVEGEDFTAIHARRSQGLAWRAAKLLSGRGNFSWSLYAAFSNLAYPFFERGVWKHFGPRLQSGEFNLVHRITPLSPTTTSWLSGPLSKHKIPFVMGPLNGGVPWPEGFDEIRKNERDWAGKLRRFHTLLPGSQSTRTRAAAILTASRSCLRDMPPQVRDRCVFIPENAIDPARFTLERHEHAAASSAAPLHIAFVGRLVALKGVDMLIEAAAPLVRDGKVTLDLIGDGPEMARLRDMAEMHRISAATRLDGWEDHAALPKRLRSADVMAFPSIREFGGGAVLEAMALGIPPIVLDHGGPPELVAPGTGFVLPLKSRAQIVSDLRALFERLVDDRASLSTMGAAAQSHVRSQYTWQKKAEQIEAVYQWVLGHRADKPDWGMPMGFSSAS